MSFMIASASEAGRGRHTFVILGQAKRDPGTHA
jgi:hypothetical protein